MSDNKFTEHMEVEKIGTLKPGDIGLGTCDGCEKNIHKFPGVLIQGITSDAAKLLYEKVEIVPAGTKARLEKLEASNKELRELVCEFGLNIADQDYLLRPDTISRTISIMVEEKEKDGWYGNKLKEKQGGYSND